MFAVVNIVRVDHSLQIPGLFFRPPFQSLVYDDVVKYEVKQSITENAEADRNHVRIVDLNTIVVKQEYGWQTEHEGE
jgi:hypothetical protein